MQLLAAAVMAPLLIWPALVNRYPLLFPDTLDYLGQGRGVVTAILHAQHPPFGGMRSAIYSLGIYPFHRNLSPWPILALPAAAIVYTVYLTVRSVAPRRAARHTLALLAALSVLTGMSWYLCLLMPDILGAPLYLALYLFVFAAESLHPGDRVVLALLAIFCAASHSAHLLVALLLCVLLSMLKLLRWRPLAGRGRGLTFAFTLLAATALLQTGLNLRLYHHASIDGNRPPYLEARMIADGPARLYLQQHCDEHTDWELCKHVAELPDNDDLFLWEEGGIWPSATPAQQAALLHEEMPLALATLRTYPGALIQVSFSNFISQLSGFGLDDFDNNNYMQANVDAVLRNARPAYDRSLQAHNATPWQPFTAVQNITVLLSLAVLAVCLPALLRKGEPRWMGLTLIVLATLLLNAAVTGILSEVDSRYQACIVWLLPLLAGLLLLHRFGAGSAPKQLPAA